MNHRKLHPVAKHLKTNKFHPGGGRPAPGGLPGPQSDEIGAVGGNPASLAAANAPMAPLVQAGDNSDAGVA